MKRCQSQGRGHGTGAAASFGMPGTETACQHATRVRRACLWVSTDGAQEGVALGHGLWRRIAKTWADAILGRIAIGGRTPTALQRAVRSQDILAVRDSPSRCALRWRGGLISHSPRSASGCLIARSATSKVALRAMNPSLAGRGERGNVCAPRDVVANRIPDLCGWKPPRSTHNSWQPSATGVQSA